MNYKAVLFDLDDTLCNTSTSKTEVFGKIVETNPKLQKLPYTDTVTLLIKERENYLKKAKGFQTFSRVDFWLRVIREMKVSISCRELKKIIDDYWKFTLSELSLYPNAAELLTKLHNSKLQTAVLASSDFYSKSSKLIKLKIDSYFDYVFTSDLVKIPKTDPAIYKYVAKFLKLKPKEILMVGDDPVQDIAPAKKAGFTTAQVLISDTYKLRKSGEARPNFAIYKLEGISAIIGN